MSTGGKGADEGAGKRDSPVSDAEVDGAEATESGYRRDDYWREAADGDTEPADVPEPAQGYAFESVEERAKADGSGSDETSSGQAAEQGGAGGRDDARTVDD